MFGRGSALCSRGIRALVFVSLIALFATFTLTGCGGSATPPSVTVTATATTVDGTDTVKLTATVANDKGTDGVAWSVSGGGALSDTTTSSATYTAPAATSAAQTVTVTATSVADTTKTGSATMTIPAKPAITAPSSAQLTGAVGSAYSLQLASTGGIAPYTWALTSGTLPTGWTLTTGGLLSGPAAVAGQAGAIDLTFTATDSGTPTALTTTVQLTVTIAPAPAIVFSGTMPTTATYQSSAPYAGFATASGGAGALTYSVASGSLPPGLALMSTANGEVGGTPTAAGTYNFSIQATDAFGDAATQAYTITVNPASPTLSFAAISTHTYGDAAFSASASSASTGAITYSVTSGPATINGSTGLVTLTGAGTVVLGASQAASSNYTAATATTTFTVNKAAATVAVTPYTVTYDGAAHTATATVTGVGSATLSASDVTLTGTTHTNAGTYATDAWSFTDPAGNYADASGTVSDKINQAAATIDVTPYSVTYDAAAHTATATAIGIGGANLIADLTLTGTTHTNAGTYSSDAWSFTDANGNYANASGTVSDKISQATATVNVTGYSVTYNGAAHTATATATGVGGAALSASDFTLTGTTHTNAGSYASDAWSFADQNYASQSGTVSDTISQATATVSVTGYTVTYDGNAHTATATATGVGGVSLAVGDFALTATAHTNAGTYPNDAWSFADPNYVSQSGTVSDTINAATPVLAFAAIPTHTYGDAAFTASASSASTGLITYSLTSGPATIDPTTGAVTLTGAGTVTLGASQAATANYNAATASITFTVSKATATIHVTGYNVTYDTNAHTATATATGVGGVSLPGSDFTLTGTTHTSAGTYAADAWSFADGSGNYNTASGTVSDTIAKATATISVTPYSVTYDATAHTATATATGIGAVALPTSDFTLTGTTHTNAGTYLTDAWSFADANYASANGTVADTIVKAAAVVNVSGYSVTYDGTAHTATASATGLGGVALSAGDFTLTGTTHTNAGSYAADAWSFADQNYLSQNGIVSDAISQAAATVNVTGYTVTYDTKQHTATATATGVGGVSLPVGDFTLTATAHTNAGTYPNDAWSFADQNYLSQSGTVSDTINTATPTLSFGAIPTHTYGDAAFTASASSASTGLVTYSLTSGPATIDPSTGSVTLTGAGTVALGASQAATANYTSATASITFTVNKATATIVVTPYNVTYDGNAHTATATATGVGGVSLNASDVVLTGTTHTNAGSYSTDAWSFSDASGNYNNATGTVSDSIAKALATFYIIPYNVTYDGTAHTITATATGVGSVALPTSDFTLTGTTHTNAGNYTTDSWSFTDPNGNYNNGNGTVSDSIAKATATVSVTGYTVTYDGNTHTATASATGLGSVALPAGDFTLTSTAHINAGSYASDAWSFADQNYVSQNGTVSDTINQATAIVNVTGYAVTYDGNAHKATATATGVGSTSLPAGDFTLTGTTHTNAGPYSTDAWSFADTNYVSQSGTVFDTIYPAEAMIVVTPYNLTFDGNAHTATATATGVGGVNLSAGLTLSGTTHTNAGTYTGDSWNFTDPNPTHNYYNADGTVNDQINQASATINVTAYTVTYDGNAHTATGTATGAGGANLNGDLVLSGTMHTNAGTYTGDPWSFSDASGNYAPTNGTVNDTINAASPMLSLNPIGTKVYGTPPAGDGPFTASANSLSTGAITYSVTSGPATVNGSTGLVTLTSTGTVSLHASQAAAGNYTAATADTSFQVNPTLSIGTSSLPSGAAGAVYSQQLAASGGFGPYSWTTDSAGTANLLAIGLSLSSTGLVSGNTPIAGGPESFTATLSDSSGHSTQVTLSVTITTIAISTTSLPIGYTSVNYPSAQLTATGGAGGNTWSVSGANNLATYGLTLSSSGLVSGTIPSNAPTGTSVVTFTAQVMDKNNATATKPLTITVYNPLSLPLAGPLPDAVTGAAYSDYVYASGGSGSYSFSVNGALVPSSFTNIRLPIPDAGGLAGSRSGNALLVEGPASSSGTFTLNVTVIDTGVTPNLSYGPIAYTITVGPQQPLALPDPSTNPLPASVNINQGYNGGLNASGGANGVTYSFSVQINGQTTIIPTDNSQVTLTNGGGLTAWSGGGNTLFFGGTPTVAGTYTLLVTVSDSANDPPASQSYTINLINPAAGYNVSGTVNYSGSKTGWIYLQLTGNNCGNCGGPGTAIPAKGSFTIKGVQSGNYVIQAYMDPLGFGAPNASDPSSNLFPNVNVNVNSGAVTGLSVSLGDPSAISFNSAPSISVSGAFASGAFVQLNSLPTNSNGVEMATSYTVRWSSDGFNTVAGSKSFPATGSNNAPLIVSGLTNGQTYSFEVQAVAGSSNSSWSSPTQGVQIVDTPATGTTGNNNAVSGKVTFAGTATGPLYVGFYDQNTGNIYATVVGSQSNPPTSPASYSLNVPTGTNYFLFGVVDNNNNGVISAPGEITNVNQQGSAPVSITGSTTTENFALPMNTAGTAPKNSTAVIRTSHYQQIGSNGTNDNYGIDIRIDGIYKLPASVELTSKPSAQTVVEPSDWATGAFNGNVDEFDFQPNLNGGTPQVGDAYDLLVTYTDTTSETLTVTVGAVLNALATLNSPAPMATGVSPTPNFNWTDPSNSANYTYYFQLQDTNYNTIWQIPGKNSHSNGFSNSITSINWGNDPTGSGSTPSANSLNSLTNYQWSIQATDANGNSAQETAEFETGEVSLTLPDNSTPGSALVGSPYSQSLNASGGSGSGYVFTVNGSAGTTVGGVTTWTLTDGLTASTSTSDNSQLTVSGTPTTAPAQVTASVSVVDSQNHSAGPVTYTINVINGPNGAHNSYLNGTYVCKTDGFNDSDGARFSSLSTIAADGAGHFSSGVFDENGRDNLSGSVTGTMGGTYSVGSDNNGLATISGTFTSGATGSFSTSYALAITNLVTPAQEFRMVESDDLGASPSGKHGTADCYLATTSAFAASTISGKSFAFGVQGENGNGIPKASAGRFSASSGLISAGILDGMRVDQTSDNGGTFTGSYTAPSGTTGRFTLSFTTGGGTITFAGYVIDANRMFLLETAGDTGLLEGDMRTQQQSSYSATNLSGAFVFYSQGFEYSNNAVSGYDSGVNQASGNGAGSVTIDQSYQDSNGTYQVGKMNGATVGITFDPSYPGRSSLAAGSDTIYWYFYGNNSAFHLDMGNSGYLETGWIEPQSQSTFTNAAVAGTYLFGEMPAMQASQTANVGEMTLLSNGNITAGLSDGGQGEFAYDQSQNMSYTWDTSTTNTGTFLVGSGSKGASCAVISASKAACINNGDSSPAVMIFQK